MILYCKTLEIIFLFQIISIDVGKAIHPLAQTFMPMKQSEKECLLQMHSPCHA